MQTAIGNRLTVENDKRESLWGRVVAKQRRPRARLSEVAGAKSHYRFSGWLLRRTRCRQYRLPLLAETGSHMDGIVPHFIHGKSTQKEAARAFGNALALVSADAIGRSGVTWMMLFRTAYKTSSLIECSPSLRMMFLRWGSAVLTAKLR